MDSNAYELDENRMMLNIRAMAALFMVHFSGDFYQSFIHPLYPILRNRFELSLTQIGMIAGVVTVSSFVSQPLMGLLADRYHPRRFMFCGLALSALFIPLMGVTPWFWLLVFVAGLGALGSSMYHPTAADMVSQYAGKRPGFGMSVFGLGGTLAFSLGPLTVTTFVVVWGLDRLPFTSVFGGIILLIVSLLLPKSAVKKRAEKTFIQEIRDSLGPSWKAVMVIWFIASMRSITDVGIRSFFPILFVDSGHSLISAGVVLSLYIFGGSASAMICGALADYIGYKPIFYASFALSPPCILWFVFSKGIWVFPAAFVVGFMVLATMFPSVALANRIAPNGRSLVSAITLGFAVGAGGLFAPLIGRIAECVGLLPVMAALATTPLICLAFIPMVPEYRSITSPSTG